MIDLGKMIRTLRKRAGLNQPELARLLNCTKQTVSNYERNQRQPDYVTLEALADIFNVPMAMLISPEDQARELARIYASYPQTVISETAPAVSAHVLSDNESELLRLFRCLNDVGRSKLLDFAGDLVDIPKYKKENTTSSMA